MDKFIFYFISHHLSLLCLFGVDPYQYWNLLSRDKKSLFVLFKEVLTKKNIPYSILLHLTILGGRHLSAPFVQEQSKMITYRKQVILPILRQRAPNRFVSIVLLLQNRFRILKYWEALCEHGVSHTSDTLRFQRT